jgi:hypothetical protein
MPSDLIRGRVAVRVKKMRQKKIGASVLIQSEPKRLWEKLLPLPPERGAQLAAGSAAAGMPQGLFEDASPIRRPWI